MNDDFGALLMISTCHHRELLEEAARVRLADALALESGPRWDSIGTALRRVSVRLEALLRSAHVRPAFAPADNQ